MASTKTQHFIPRFYLRYFTNADGKLMAYRRNSDSFFPAKPENVCAQNYLYEVRQNGFEKNPPVLHNYIEDQLAGAEGRLSILYGKLIACCDDRTFQGKAFLDGRLSACILAANLLVRHPLILGDERKKAGVIAGRVIAQGGITEQEQKELERVGLENDLEGVAEIAIMQASLFSDDSELPFHRIYNVLADKKMSIVEAPVGMGFITTCMPIDFVGTNEDNYEFTEAFMPLSSKYAAHFTDNATAPDIRKASIKEAVRYNTALLVRGALWSTAMAAHTRDEGVSHAR
jgi:hypothetical protein